MNTKEIFRLVASIFICQGAGIIGALFTMPAIRTWYETLNKPSFRPPNAVFGPVWTILFLLMGVSLYLIWHKGLASQDVKTALLVFLAHLVLNIGWSVLFFGLRSPGLAFFEIVILWLAILLTMYLFYRVSLISGLLLLPYALWVSFAAILNFTIWRLNR
jgi:benzodiazapine receptor